MAEKVLEFKNNSKKELLSEKYLESVKEKKQLHGKVINSKTRRKKEESRTRDKEQESKAQ